MKNLFHCVVCLSALLSVMAAAGDLFTLDGESHSHLTRCAQNNADSSFNVLAPEAEKPMRLLSVSTGTGSAENRVIEHGGGLNACGCHYNRTTGECHCHQTRGCGCSCQPESCF